MLTLTELQYKLSSLGNIVSLKQFVNPKAVEKSILDYKEHFKTYNPRKKGYNRYGLSITSQDGGFSGIPNLDSLKEYNKRHGTNFDEPDFRKWTPFFKDCKALRDAVSPFHDFIGRSHVLRLDKGGFIPPHRDGSQASFRFFVTLCEDVYVFLLDEKKIFCQSGKIYYINTMLNHSLFSFRDGSLFIVFNIDLCEDSVKAVYQNLEIC